MGVYKGDVAGADSCLLQSKIDGALQAFAFGVGGGKVVGIGG